MREAIDRLLCRAPLDCDCGACPDPPAPPPPPDCDPMARLVVSGLPDNAAARIAADPELVEQLAAFAAAHPLK